MIDKIIDKKWCAVLLCGVFTLWQTLGLIPKAEAKMVRTPHMPVSEVDDRLPWGKTPGRLFGEISEPQKYASPELQKIVAECDKILEGPYAGLFYLLKGVDKNGNGTLIRNATLADRIRKQQGDMALSIAKQSAIILLDEFFAQNAKKASDNGIYNEIGDAVSWLCMSFASMSNAHTSLLSADRLAPIYQGKIGMFKQIDAAKYSSLDRMRPPPAPIANPVVNEAFLTAVVMNRVDSLNMFASSMCDAIIKKGGNAKAVEQAQAMRAAIANDLSPLYYGFTKTMMDAGIYFYYNEAVKLTNYDGGYRGYMEQMFLVAGNYIFSQQKFQSLAKGQIIPVDFKNPYDTEATAAIMEPQTLTVDGKQVTAPKYTAKTMEFLDTIDARNDRAIQRVLQSLMYAQSAGIDMVMPRYEIQRDTSAL